MNGYRRATWLLIALWFLLYVTTLNYNGPFLDQATYVVEGQRTREDHGYSDGYLVWFGGSLLWPVLSAIGYRVAGLIGTRLVALPAASICLLAMSRAADHLFDAELGFWSALIFAVSGPFIALARLGVYDALALAGLATSLWAVTRLVTTDKPEDIRQQIRRCANFQKVFSASGRVINLGTDSRFINYPVGPVIWQNRSLGTTR